MERKPIRLRRDLAALVRLVRVDALGAFRNIRLARQATARGALQKVRELAPALGIVRRISPGVVVEIGSARGGTIYAWTRVARADALLVSIDLPDGPFGGGGDRADSTRIRAAARARQQVRLIRADSHAPATVEALRAILAGRGIDFLFIDGDHTFDGVRTDFELYAPLVRPGGVIALHDIVRHPPGSGCEVDRFWNVVKVGRRHVELVDAGGSEYGGIGVLYVDG